MSKLFIFSLVLVLAALCPLLGQTQVFNQPYDIDGGAYTSALVPSYPVDYEVADNFSALAGPFNKFVFYGYSGVYSGGWIAGTPNATEPFFIKVYNSYWVPPDPGLLLPVTGTYTIRMYDSYGDGWNGGYLDVYVNGSLIQGGVTLPSGAGPEDFTFSANAGDYLFTDYVAGGWAYENWYQVLDPSLAVIAQDGDDSQTIVPTGIGNNSTYIAEPVWNNPVHSWALNAAVTYIGPAWDIWSMYKYEVDLPSDVTLTDGWISAQINSAAGSGQWFLWNASLTGDGLSYQRVGAKGNPLLAMVSPPGAPKDVLYLDMAFELYGPPTGIIIDEDAGTLPPPGVTITEGGTIPPELLGPDSGNPAVLYTVEATGTWDVTVFKPAAWTVDWYCWIKVGGVLYAGGNPIPAATPSWTFTGIDFGTKGAKGEATVVMNDNQTLPVELSSFTAVLTAEMFVNIAWVSESETNHLGYNVLRGTSDDPVAAIQLNDLAISEGTSLGSQTSYSYLDTEVTPGTTYWYWLESLDLGGASTLHGPVSVLVAGEPDDPGIPPLPPTVTKLLPAYPNPFNPSTIIRYQLVEPTRVRVEICNAKGQLMRVYENNHTEPGYYQVMWDGRDAQGNAAASGVYLYRMTAGNYTSSRKMVLAK